MVGDEWNASILHNLSIVVWFCWMKSVGGTNDLWWCQHCMDVWNSLHDHPVAHTKTLFCNPLPWNEWDGGKYAASHQEFSCVCKGSWKQGAVLRKLVPGQRTQFRYSWRVWLEFHRRWWTGRVKFCCNWKEQEWARNGEEGVWKNKTMKPVRFGSNSMIRF